jgi:hypothetical protein
MSREPVKAETNWLLVAAGVFVLILTGGLTWFFWNSHDVGFGAFLGFSVGGTLVLGPFLGDWMDADPPLAGEKGHGGARKATQAEAKEKLGGREERPPWANHHYQD